MQTWHINPQKSLAGWSSFLLAALICIVGGCFAAHAQIIPPVTPASTFWGQEFTNQAIWPTGNQSIPTVYGAIRMNSTTWGSIENGSGAVRGDASTWNFAYVDKYLANFPGKDLLYTFTTCQPSHRTSVGQARPHRVT